MSRRVTMVQVAQAAGVSVGTVSNVLNSPVRVAKRTQNRVHNAIKQLGYQHNLAAKALKTGISNTIGLLVPELASPYFSELAKLVVNSAKRSGYLVCVTDTSDAGQQELDSLNLLFSHGVQGVIWFDPRLPESEIKKHTNGRFVVVVDRQARLFDSITLDYEAGGRKLGEYILANGHKRVGLISGPNNHESARQRRAGIKAALYRRAKVVWDYENQFKRELSEETISALKRKEATAVVCANDDMAIAALMTMNEAGIRVPDEVSLTGFDNVNLCDVLHPTLTSVAFPMREIVDEAVDIVIRRVEGDRSRKRHRILKLELVPRDSVKNVS